ncbi:hypothetical protein HDU97_006651 [Phlyctochytrium planicorne]|nr:hypothetical protein HDU97_006651 [Phlyctochytrium planicorne]
MRVPFATLLGLGSIFSAVPTLAYVTNSLVTDILPVEFDNQIFTTPLTNGPFVGKLVNGPFVREGRKGNVYIAASVKGNSTQCAYATISPAGKILIQGIIDSKRTILPPGPCVVYGLVRGYNGATYHIGTSDGKPFVAKYSVDQIQGDADFLTFTKTSLTALLAGKNIVSAAIAVNQNTGDVYTAWNLDDGVRTFAYLLKITQSTNGVAVFQNPIGINYAKIYGLYVLPNNNIMASGITLDRIDRPGTPTLTAASLFAIWYSDPMNGAPGSIVEQKVWVAKGGNQLVDLSVSVDEVDYSVYFAATLETRQSVLFKLTPVIPRVDVSLPLKQIGISGPLTSTVTSFPESFAFVAADIDTVGNIVYVTDYNLQTKSPLKLPASSAGETFLNIAASRQDLGTLVGVSIAPTTNYDGTLTVRKFGNKLTRVRIYHKKTGLALTMTLDAKVVLFPLDTSTKHQEFDFQPFTRHLRNVQLNLDVTTRGRPFPYSTYDQEKGYKLVGEPHLLTNRRQRWGYNNRRLVSLKDKKCISLDRNFLVNGRFPRTYTGFPLITVDCSTDKMQIFDIVHAA